MGGNALNRDLAAAYIVDAENSIDDICDAGRNVAKKIFTLNEGYAGASSASMVTQAYVQYLTALRNCVNNFGLNMQDTNNALVKQINSGADGDDVHPTVGAHDVSIGVATGDTWIGSGLIFNKEMAGIHDFATTQNDVNSLNTAVQMLISTTDKLIYAYKHLYELGSNSNNTNLCDTAHEAAEVVRGYVSKFEEAFKEGTNLFMNSIKNQMEYATGAKESTINALDAMQANFNSVDFTNLSS